ncbi:AtpZ/AtpI family protein [Flavobacterium amniphilum]|uniref:AtpZ/AtpI family protein n=1 Tax=Flavobacterium amniphilum TaxID=1834035 RepID=UPI002029E1A7|nr:AtpZ/AtpI family protein [Flavobacterium amniphilum]MCL9804081.1 AtpZ/AtpI family protein [Flavobacterium amniphilum]
MENNKPEPKKANKWLVLINIPIQMGLIIFLFFKLGEWLDINHPNDKIYYSKLLTVVGVFLALYSVIKQVNRLGNNN